MQGAPLRLLALVGLASLRGTAVRLLHAIRRRAAFAIAVTLLWVAAFGFAVVALTLLVAVWVGTLAATAILAAVMAVAAIVVHLIGRRLDRQQR
jgi:hypothetical protein